MNPFIFDTSFTNLTISDHGILLQQSPLLTSSNTIECALAWSVTLASPMRQWWWPSFLNLTGFSREAFEEMHDYLHHDREPRSFWLWSSETDDKPWLIRPRCGHLFVTRLSPFNCCGVSSRDNGIVERRIIEVMKHLRFLVCEKWILNLLFAICPTDYQFHDG